MLQSLSLSLSLSVSAEKTASILSTDFTAVPQSEGGREGGRGRENEREREKGRGRYRMRRVKGKDEA